jgi:hypothetical protein
MASFPLIPLFSIIKSLYPLRAGNFFEKPAKTMWNLCITAGFEPENRPNNSRRADYWL